MPSTLLGTKYAVGNSAFLVPSWYRTEKQNKANQSNYKIVKYSNRL